VDEPLPRGEYSRTFEAGALPNGVYFCRLVAAEGSETRKLLRVR
jgi:hypothetical protein